MQDFPFRYNGYVELKKLTSFQNKQLQIASFGFIPAWKAINMKQFFLFLYKNVSIKLIKIKEPVQSNRNLSSILL